jgi:hypothetical protein
MRHLTQHLMYVSDVHSFTAAEETVATASEEETELLAAKVIDQAVEIVAEMQLTSEQIRVRSLGCWPPC